MYHGHAWINSARITVIVENGMDYAPVCLREEASSGSAGQWELAQKASDILTPLCNDFPEDERADEVQRERLKQIETSLMQMLHLKPTACSLSWRACSLFISQFCRGWEVKGICCPPRRGQDSWGPGMVPTRAKKSSPQSNPRLGVWLEQDSAAKTLNSHTTYLSPCVLNNTFSEPQVDGWIYELHPITGKATSSAGRPSSPGLYLCR